VQLLRRGCERALAVDRVDHLQGFEGEVHRSEN
jgi:hypothetical protein